MKLKIKALDQNGRGLPCRITIQRLTFEEEQYTEGLLKTIYCEGEYECSLEDGIYDINVHKGKLYKPFRQRIHVEGEDISIEAVLSPLVNGLNAGLLRITLIPPLIKNTSGRFPMSLDIDKENLFPFSLGMVGKEDTMSALFIDFDENWAYCIAANILKECYISL
jgi:hypothetical protein